MPICHLSIDCSRLGSTMKKQHLHTYLYFVKQSINLINHFLCVILQRLKKILDQDFKGQYLVCMLLKSKNQIEQYDYQIQHCCLATLFVFKYQISTNLAYLNLFIFFGGNKQKFCFNFLISVLSFSIHTA